MTGGGPQEKERSHANLERMAVMRILIVDDEPPMRSALQAVFEHAEADVRVAADAESALLRLAESAADLVIVDKNLPGKSGVDFVRALRTHDEVTAVVMMSAYPTAASVTETMNLGIDAYLEKPFGDIFEVVDLARSILATRSAESTGPIAGRALRTAIAVGTVSAERLLGPLGRYEALALTGTEDELLERLPQGAPELVVLDASAFRSDIAAVVERLRARLPNAAVVVVHTAALPLASLRRLVHLGVRGLFDADEYPERMNELLARHDSARPDEASG